MKRDWNIIREVLLAVESVETLDAGSIEVGYNFWLCGSAGWINNNLLTHKGHEFLALIPASGILGIHKENFRKTRCSDDGIADSREC